MVPKGWERKALDEISDVIDCKHRTPKYVKNGIPLVSPGTIKWGAIDLESPTKRVTAEEYESLMDHCTVEYGDLVLSRNQSVGIASFVDSDKPFVLGQDTVLVKPKGSDPRFLFYNLQSTDTQKTIFKLAGGSTFSRINLGDIRKLKAIYPPFAEQQKIAKILSTWDKAISTTERLIENGIQQKKALMQQLLTGKKRLLDESGKRFEDEWKSKVFKNILKLDRGSSPRPIIQYMTDSEDGVNWIKIGDTKGEGLYINSTKEKITKEGAEKSRKVSKGEVVLSNSMSYGKPYILNIDGYIHDGWFVIRKFEKNIDVNFLIQILSSELIQKQYKRLAAGGVVSNISSELVYAVKVDLPSIPEQQKIATVLTSADKEIELLEQQLADLQQEKKALMQQLLTGKKRVKLND